VRIYRHGDHSKKSYEVGTVLGEYMGDTIQKLKISLKTSRFE
jgi:hypothetical protein